MLNSGAGSFGSATNFGVGNTPTSIAVGNLDGTNGPDLAVTNLASNDVSVLLNTTAPAYNFSGFFAPVDNLPTFNVVKAGAAVPVKFSLGGNQGLKIFLADYSKSETIACNSTAGDGVETTSTAGQSSLSYDAFTDIYTYVWKTNKSWGNTCRQLVIKFADNSTVARANFMFKK